MGEKQLRLSTDDDTKLEDHYLYTHRRYNTTNMGVDKAKMIPDNVRKTIDNKTIKEIITELRKETNSCQCNSRAEQ